MGTSMEFFPSFYHHGGTAGSPDTGAHGPQEILQLHDLRFPGSIGNDSGSLRLASRQHGVFRGAHAGNLQKYLRAAQLTAPAMQPAVLLLYLRAQGTQGVQMQVNGARAQVASAGLRAHRLAAPGQNCPQKHHR